MPVSLRPSSVIGNTGKLLAPVGGTPVSRLDGLGPRTRVSGMVQVIVARQLQQLWRRNCALRQRDRCIEVVSSHTCLAKTWVPYSTLMACCYYTYLALSWWAL